MQCRLLAFQLLMPVTGWRWPAKQITLHQWKAQFGEEFALDIGFHPFRHGRQIQRPR